MNDIIINYIKEEISLESLDEIQLDEDLLGNGIVDSLGMMRLIVFLEKEFHMTINPEDMTVENFNSVRSISNYLSQSRT